MTRKWIILEMKHPRNWGVTKIHSQTDKNRLDRGFLVLGVFCFVLFCWRLIFPPNGVVVTVFALAV